MIVLLPHCGFLSEVSRAIEIGRALESNGTAVLVASRGGPFEHLITEAGFTVRRLDPPLDPSRFHSFVRALSAMDGKVPFFEDAELERAVAAEVELFRDVDADLVVVGFTLSAYLSTRVAGIPLATDHGGAFVPPVLAAGLCPAPVNPPDPGLTKLPTFLQRRLANRVPALMRKVTAQLDAHADALGVDRVGGLLGLMCGDLTLVTELPDVLGLPATDVEGWQPRWPFRVRAGTTFAMTGPLFARLDVPIPPDVDAFLDADGPVVYVAPNSIQSDMLRQLAQQAGRASARLLVGATTHDATELADLVDDRTMVAGVLPNHLVMPRVDAAVIMGGQGSVQTAIASATPFVGIPLHGEQELNVAVAERLGTAIRMSPGDATTPALGDALRRLLDDPAFATAAQAAARRYDGVDGAALAADAISAFLRSRGGRAASPSPA